MSFILRLSDEILIIILQFLNHKDLRTLLHSQKTCRRFHSIVRNILNNPQVAIANLKINPMLEDRFKGLFNTSHNQRLHNGISRSNRHFPELPFQMLPWAGRDDRHCYLRKEASWRCLSVTWGSLPITQLEILQQRYALAGTTYGYLRVQIPSNGLTMGLYYDLLLSGKCHYGNGTVGWKLLLGRAVNTSVVPQYRSNLREPRDRFAEFYVEVPQSAVLLIIGSRGCERRLPERRPEEISWRPEVIASKPPKIQNYSKLLQSSNL